ncbi:MmgE/PrpD family protein [Psychrobacillus sp. OK032]|uniref:MmgE/PrpD family protein n=1 Tax=Psychrobacillus sp. OK032 TaxID=1884358 RepID=UPI0008B093A2|nr:MmgE/PrpD family protein [Psychrobacillus sp. OK032]SER82429.1 2-methylcitrate dehydratase PrpD [Psychrobacillus sp. OK032]
MGYHEDFGHALAAFAIKEAPAKASPFYVDAFLNWYGCALAGSGQEVVQRAVAFYQMDAPSRLLPLIGRSERLSASASIAVDCIASASLAYDDIHFETTLHPAGPVASAILGLSRCQPVSGIDALHALRVGMEIECRVALTMFGPETGAAMGWYPTGIAGGLGAAAAVGRLLGFDAARMETALGLAAARASGTRGTHGSMAAYWVPGLAAEAGYVSARLAEAGLSCGIASLTGANGLLMQVASRPNVEAGLDGLGTQHVCETTACKPYPFGFIASAVIKCCQDLHAKIQREERKLRKLVVRVSPTAAKLGGNSEPKTVFDAHVSLRYITARVLSNPASVFEPVNEDFFVSEEIAEISRCVIVEGDKTLHNEQARCLAIFEDGSESEIRCDIAPGAPGNPLSTEDVKAKFLRLVSGIRGREEAERILSALCCIHEMRDISELLAPLP